jgi:hypothetical protein
MGKQFKRTPSTKITTGKWTGWEVAECLLCKHEALRSNSSPAKKVIEVTHSCPFQNSLLEIIFVVHCH